MSRHPVIPNLRHLKMVQMTGRCGSVNGAARKMSISQPAVTQAIAKVESGLGVQLFERMFSGSFATEIGRRYLARIDRFFNILDAATASAMSWGDAAGESRLVHADRILTSTQIRSYVAACGTVWNEGSARELGVTVRSLLRSVRSVERSIGVSLFDRTASGPVPNKVGARLAQDLGKASREIELAQEEVYYALGRESLEIVIGIPPLPGSVVLIAATEVFRAEHPLVRIRLVSGEYHVLLNDLRNGRIDLMFGILRLPKWAKDLREEALFEDRSCIVARRGHPLARHVVVSIPDLANCDWLGPPPDTPRALRIARIFADSGAALQMPVEITSLSFCKTYLLNTNAITLLPQSEVRSELESGALAEIHCKFEDDPQPKGITFRADWLPGTVHCAFIDALRAAVSRC